MPRRRRARRGGWRSPLPCRSRAERASPCELYRPRRCSARPRTTTSPRSAPRSASSAPASRTSTGASWTSGRRYPTEFVAALTEAGWLAALIPEEYGGAGLGIAEASVILEEINRSGGNAAACHAQMYIMGTLLRHGSEEQKRRYLPDDRQRRAAPAGVRRDRAERRLGDDPHRDDAPCRDGDRYVVNGQKVFISRAAALRPDAAAGAHDAVRRAERQDARALASSWSTCARRRAQAIEVRPLETMINHPTTELFIDDLEVPAENLIGEEGRASATSSTAGTPSGS